MNEVKPGEEKFYDFIEAAAHDLQAPLRKLSVLVERVFTKNENEFDERAQEHIRRIEACVDEMRSLINHLLELTQMNVATITYEPCDLNMIADETVDALREEINHEKFSVHFHSLPVVYGNSFQYKQLFRNLIENAVKFRKKNIISEIEVLSEVISEVDKTLFNLARNKKYYRIEIRDNGVGFNQANAEKIFEPFVRLNPKSEYQGNGLGLFICKKIVTNHHGIIYAEANEKEGARFVVILPEIP